MDTVTTAPETTKPDRGPLAKHWAGCTLNNYTVVDEAAFVSKIQPLADYYVYGKEVGPKNGVPHLQFMVCFKTAKRTTAVQKLLKASWTVKYAESTMKQASDYCKKDGNFIEWGILPLDPTVKGRKVIQDNYEDTVTKAKAGDLDNVMDGTGLDATEKGNT